MSNPPSFLQPDQLAVPLNCPRCGQHGLAVMEKAPARTGSEYALVSLPDAFYQRLAKAPPHRIETVCHACGAVLQDRVHEQEAPRVAATNQRG
jgi:hypothetical protein